MPAPQKEDDDHDSEDDDDDSDDDEDSGKDDAIPICSQKTVTGNKALSVSLDLVHRSALDSLLHDASMTASLGLISWEKAYALYRRETFIDHEGYLLKKLTRRDVRRAVPKKH
jgi:hypothetical protein